MKNLHTLIYIFFALANISNSQSEKNNPPTIVTTASSNTGHRDSLSEYESIGSNLDLGEGIGIEVIDIDIDKELAERKEMEMNIREDIKSLEYKLSSRKKDLRIVQREIEYFTDLKQREKRIFGGQ